MRPTKPQAMAKSRFWSSVQGNPLLSPESLPAAKVAQLAGNQQVREWFIDLEFRDWFLNKDATRQLLESAVEPTIKRLLSIIECTEVGPKGEVTAASQVNAAKLILEFAGYAPPKQRIVEYRDKEIASMDEAELVSYIQKNSTKLVGDSGAS